MPRLPEGQVSKIESLAFNFSVVMFGSPLFVEYITTGGQISRFNENVQVKQQPFGVVLFIEVLDTKGW